MYGILLELHSGVRWLVVLSIFLALVASVLAIGTDGAYTNLHTRLRSAYTGFAYLQFLVGLVLYVVSPVAASLRQAGHSFEGTFFGLIHPLLMLTGVSLVSIAGAMAKRVEGDPAKHRATLLWLGAAALVIFVAIPWPGSPFVERPWSR